VPELLTTDDLAKLLHMHVVHIRDRVTHRSDFPKAIVIGRRKLWRADEINAWLESRRA
jgi:predicted DNA-binding transcriptional regulator AlpA